MPYNIIFIHPDLGLGGAERLVVDAALSLKNYGHSVSFVTSHHDTNHCFEETKDGTISVSVVGDWLPRSIFGKFYAICAYFRMIYCAFYILFFLKPDIIFCDLVSVCIPILQLSGNKVIFYCHFPDQLLSSKGSLLKSIYRAPINWMEEVTTGCADKLFVNSKFTRSVFIKTFKSLKKIPQILYPSIHTEFFDKFQEVSVDFLDPSLPSESFVFLSINRYERKKKIQMAIAALKRLESLISEQEWKITRLIIAGGYDNRVIENKEYFIELIKLAQDLELMDKMYFLKSPSDSEKVTLLKRCDCIVYTPPNEHFGIVPLEAMYCKKPVIALNSGGPTESLIHRETGYLCDMKEEDFANAMAELVTDKNKAKCMGVNGYNRFCEKFAFNIFSKTLNDSLSEFCER